MIRYTIIKHGKNKKSVYKLATDGLKLVLLHCWFPPLYKKGHPPLDFPRKKIPVINRYFVNAIKLFYLQ